MARKLDIGQDHLATVPQPIFKVTSNEGTAQETDIMHIYAPMSTTQMTAVYAAGVPVGSTTNDSTTGKAFVVGAAAWEAIASS